MLPKLKSNFQILKSKHVCISISKKLKSNEVLSIPATGRQPPEETMEKCRNRSGHVANKHGKSQNGELKDNKQWLNILPIKELLSKYWCVKQHILYFIDNA